jgi:hypothetical protein
MVTSTTLSHQTTTLSHRMTTLRHRMALLLHLKDLTGKNGTLHRQWTDCTQKKKKLLVKKLLT